MSAAICEWLDEVTVWQVSSEFHDPWVNYFFPTNRASSTYAPIIHNVRLPGGGGGLFSSFRLWTCAPPLHPFHIRSNFNRHLPPSQPQHHHQHHHRHYHHRLSCSSSIPLTRRSLFIQSPKFLSLTNRDT
jgi:hypothetical protein